MENLFDLSWRQALALTVLFGLLITCTGLNIRELESGDETRVAGISAEMFVEGDYLIPRLNAEPFLEYPPLYYWCAAGAYAVFGVNDFAAKLPSAFAALGCGLAVFWFARNLRYPPWCALGCCVMLMTGAQFFGNSRKCMVDMLLAFFILLAVAAFYALSRARTWRGKIPFQLLFSAAATGGVMTKGLIGLVLPGAVLGSWLLIRDCMEKKFSVFSYLQLGIGVFLALFFVSFWYLGLYLRGGGEMLHSVLIVNNFGRFSGSQGDHAKPFWFYLEMLPSLFWPWLPLLPFAFWYAGQRVWRERNSDLLLLLVFLAVPFVLLSLASGKRVVYLLPLYAPAALLCGAWLTRLPARVRLLLAKYGRNPLFLKLSIGLICLALAAFAVLSQGWTMVYPLLAVTLLLAYCRVPAVQWRVLLGISVIALFFAAIDTSTAALLNRENSLRPLFEACRELEETGSEIILVNPPERTSGAAYFYLGRNLREFDKDEPMPENGMLIMRTKTENAPGRLFADYHRLLSDEEYAEFFSKTQKK